MHIPKNWTFENTSVAENFDKHVREQLPFYDLATNAISHIARHYIQENKLVYDIGASTGNIGNSLKSIIETRKAKLIALEKSKEMCNEYKGYGTIVNADATNYPFKEHCLSILYLVLMFIPLDKRDSLINNLFQNLNKGGAIIIFDKEISYGGYFGTVLYRLILANKIASGVSAEDVIAKELSLAGVQIPFDPSNYKDLEIKRWFKYGDFGSWIIEKK